MARIDMNRFLRVDKERNSIQDEVYATYTVFILNNEKYVQIDTYGKDDREKPEKSSQIIQFDRSSAEFLVKLLAKEYNMTFNIC